MTRLYDKLNELPTVTPLPNRDLFINPLDVASHTRLVRELISDATVVEATNVAEHFIENYVEAQRSPRDLLHDLKVLCPPFDKTFFEWTKMPAMLSHHAARMGLLVLGTLADDAEAAFRDIVKDADHTPKQIAKMRENPECHWILMGFDFIQFKRPSDPEHASNTISPLRGPYTAHLISVAADGTYVDSYWSYLTGPDQMSEDEQAQIATSGMIAWLALALMNCQNVSTEDHAPKRRMSKKQKRRLKNGKKQKHPNPLTAYKTIHIDPSKGPQRSQRNGSGNGTRKAPDKVRGHMKRYKGKGLFGKYKGCWYWGPQLSDDTSTDYEIDKPKNGKGDD
jgi:hypothetical protein